jgi:60 kDa SS-A/Ro ribonucleoprotein
MANKELFESIVGKLLPKADALNETMAPAYAFTSKHALAQYAATGCFNRTYYASAGEQLAKVIELCQQVDAEFIARVAIYARERGLMKDLPALLCAILSLKDPALFKLVFPRVIDKGKMLRNFVQIMRSGVIGRKSLGTAPKRLIRDWFDARTEEEIFKAAVGQSPSLADIVKMIHPKPKTTSREALFGYFIGRAHDAGLLPPVVREFEAFKAAKLGERGKAPDVPFQMLTALELGAAEWAEIARNASWQTLRMNLNTFARHGVFELEGMARAIARRLADPTAVRKARVFPFQLLTAHSTTEAKVPEIVREALREAVEVAIGNVPRLDGKVYVFPDVSGSMHSPVTGYRKGATSKVRCLDVAALVAASIVRRNPRAEVIPFSDEVVKVDLDARESVLANAAKLAALPSGGTNCSAPLQHLNRRKAAGDLVIYVSDNESWVDARQQAWNGGGGTETMRQWSEFKRRNREARMVCIDIQPYSTTQAKEREEILNIGGFSDQVFDLIAEFAAGRLSADHWIGVIEKIAL